jgi:hypothetical protein
MTTRSKVLLLMAGRLASSWNWLQLCCSFVAALLQICSFENCSRRGQLISLHPAGASCSFVAALLQLCSALFNFVAALQLCSFENCSWGGHLIPLHPAGTLFVQVYCSFVAAGELRELQLG